ncbi:MAG: CRTAC1 family protein [Myxococcales bacterium]|jgi:hypothetical protein
MGRGSGAVTIVGTWLLVAVGFGCNVADGAPADAGPTLSARDGSVDAAIDAAVDAAADGGSRAARRVDMDAGVGDGAGPADTGAQRAADAGAPMDAAAESVDAEVAVIGPAHFVDVTDEAGLRYAQAPIHDEAGGGGGVWYRENGLITDAPFMTGGAAAGDYDGDGLVDLYVTRLHEPGILYRNLGDGTFEDVTVEAGLAAHRLKTVGPLWVDVDNDGDLDLYVTTLRGYRFLLFINEGGFFTEEGELRGVALADGQTRQGYGVSAGDYDRDGWLDLHTAEWTSDMLSPPYPSHSRMLRGRGAEGPQWAGHFEDATADARVVLWDADKGHDTTFQSVFTDLDDDGYPDLFVARDFGHSRLFWNTGFGGFADGTRDSRVGTAENAMGVAVGDQDGDGLLDVFVTSIACRETSEDAVGCSGNRLYRNLGNRRFSDVTDDAGVRDGKWGWGTTFFELDNDGDLDLTMTNGVRFPAMVFSTFFADRTRLWRNDGQGAAMGELARQLGIRDTGDGKALLVFDYDVDGDQDIFIADHVSGGKLFRNDGATGDYLRIALRGSTANSFGIGARVRVTVEDGAAPMVRELRAGGSFLSQDEPVLHFGLGEGEAPVARVEVTWPNPGVRKVQVLTGVARNQVLVLDEPE